MPKDGAQRDLKGWKHGFLGSRARAEESVRNWFCRRQKAASANHFLSASLNVNRCASTPARFQQNPQCHPSLYPTLPSMTIRSKSSTTTQINSSQRYFYGRDGLLQLDAEGKPRKCTLAGKALASETTGVIERQQWRRQTNFGNTWFRKQDGEGLQRWTTECKNKSEIVYVLIDGRDFLKGRLRGTIFQRRERSLHVADKNTYKFRC